MFIDLCRRKAFKDRRHYPIPAGVGPGACGCVVIGCGQFGVLISPARLSAAGSSGAATGPKD